VRRSAPKGAALAATAARRRLDPAPWLPRLWYAEPPEEGRVQWIRRIAILPGDHAAGHPGKLVL